MTGLVTGFIQILIRRQVDEQGIVETKVGISATRMERNFDQNRRYNEILQVSSFIQSLKFHLWQWQLEPLCDSSSKPSQTVTPLLA